MRRILAAVAAFAATAYSLPGDLVVLSAKEVRPDEGAGLYYLGEAAGGFLYNGGAGAVARVAPYRLLDRGARDKDYYVAWAPAPLAAASFAAFGSAAALGPDEVLVGVNPEIDADGLRAVDRRIELRALQPITPATSRYAGEPPPTQKDAAIEAAVNTITEQEYAGYIQTLQDFGTRHSGFPGCDLARDYLKDFFAAQGLNATLFEVTHNDETYYNVVAERRGTSSADEIIIIGAHYDSTAGMSPGGYAPGAEDNASGTAAVMAAARALRSFQFDRTVRYIAFGGEEQGCWGSYGYAYYCHDHGENIVAVLVADMVAYDEENGGRDDYVVDVDKYKWLHLYFAGVGALYGQNLIYEEGSCGSDQESFWFAGYPALGAIEGSIGAGGSASYPYYHTTQDTLDKLEPAFAVRFVKDYAATLAHLARFNNTGVDEPTVPSGPAHPRARPFAVYPNPYHYASGGGVTFANVAAPATITVYDLAGRKIGGAAVAAGREEYSWAPRAADGSRLVPGLYLYRVKGTAQEETGKLVVTE